MRSWKSTGFAFSISCDNDSSLENAVKNVKKETMWYNSGENKYCFDYSKKDTIIAITVYAPAKD